MDCPNCGSDLVEVTHGVSFTVDGVKKAYDNFECGKCGTEFWARRLSDGGHKLVQVEGDFITGKNYPEAE